MIIQFIRKLFGRDASRRSARQVLQGFRTAAPAALRLLAVFMVCLRRRALPAQRCESPISASCRKRRRHAPAQAPVIVPADQHRIDPALLSKPAVRVTETLQQAGYRAFIVGGAVRDLLLGVAPKDFDVATDATPEQVVKLFRRARLIGRRFQIVHVPCGREIIEVSTFRALAPAAATEDPLRNGSERPPTGRRRHSRADRGIAQHRPMPDDGRAVSARLDAETVGGATETRHGAIRSAAAAARRLRENLAEPRTHTVDASGRVLRDNVWGEQHEDATRRDFTVNAMYYDPATQTVHDYHRGIDDIRARRLRMIGDPATRFREDPVRMLRVVRFAAKLGFEIETDTRQPIGQLAGLIHNVPAARLFDEMLKLLLSGHALACLQRLRSEGLHHGLLPLLDVVLEQPHGERFVSLALTGTDQRVRAGKPVSPGFLFAALLWQQVQDCWQQFVAAGDYPIPALHRAMDDVLERQTESLAIQRRYVGDMKEIWNLQPRFERRSRGALRLLEHPRFRAGYDFLLLRCQAGELEPGIGQWWTEFVKGDQAAREALIASVSAEPGAQRRRRRGGRRSAQAMPPDTPDRQAPDPAGAFNAPSRENVQ